MSIFVSDDQVRLDILELLYKNLRDNPSGSGIDRAIIQDNLKISENQMDTNMSYLEDKTLVTIRRTISSQWTFAKITAEGIDVIENKESYVDKFPFAQASTSQIHEEVQQKVSFTQQVTDTFKQAHDQVRATKLSTADKGKIENQLKALEKELQKTKKADIGTIQKNWEELKKKASWLNPTIAQVVLEGIKIALDIQ
jgi:hypothetical protein